MYFKPNLFWCLALYTEGLCQYPGEPNGHTLVTVNTGFITSRNCRENDCKIVALEEKEVSQMPYLPLHILAPGILPQHCGDRFQAQNSLYPVLLQQVSGVKNLLAICHSKCALVSFLKNTASEQGAEK